MNLDSMIAEHKRLLKTLKTPSRQDDAQEFAIQKKEFKGLIKKKKKKEEEGNEEATYPSQVTGAP